MGGEEDPLMPLYLPKKFGQKGLGWPCPVSTGTQKDFNSFSIMFYYIISTTYWWPINIALLIIREFRLVCVVLSRHSNPESAHFEWNFCTLDLASFFSEPCSNITKPQLLLIVFSLINHTYSIYLFSNLFIQPSPISKINEPTWFTGVSCQIGLVFNKTFSLP